MRKGQLAVWAILTFALAGGVFVFAMPTFNRAKSSGDAARGFGFLLLPFFLQIVWFAGGVLYSAYSKRREPILGILFGFGLEILALAGLVIFSASAPY